MRVLGNRKNLKYLSDAAKSGRLSHAYMICGDKGMGKKTFAENAAAALLCERLSENTGFAPCGRCAACKRSLSGNHPDIIKITHAKDSVLSADEIRDQLVNDIYIKPFYGPYKIYIAADACLMQPEGLNAILKTIEEPPAYAVVFLLADNADMMPDTVKSRCVRLDMEALSDEIITAQLSAKGADAKEARRTAAYCAGNLGLALKIYEDKAYGGLIEYISDILSDIKGKDAAQLFGTAETLSKYETADIPDMIRRWYRDVLVLKAAKGRRLYFTDKEDVLKEQAVRLSYEDINNIFTELDEAQMRLKFNVNAKAVYETLLLRIRHNG